MDERDLSKEAAQFIRRSKKELITNFADLKKHPQDVKPASVFMAGSPGAGKTEFSKNLIKELGDGVVRIDPDEIRSMLPIEIYNGKNAHLFQNAVSIGTDELFNFVLKNKQNFILDGTMASLEVAKKNLSKTLSLRDYVEIYYIYQDPVVAWKFTQDREALEGRNISKEAFINAFVSSKENVSALKGLFGDKVRLNLVIKDYTNGVGKIKLDIEKLDSHLEKFYTKEQLDQLL